MKLLVIFLSLILLNGFSSTAYAERPKSEMQKYVDGMHPGWNLGNTLDAAGSETSWGNPRTTKELIDAIGSAGFKSIRIPVTWGHRMGPGPDYLIDSAFLERVASIVQWSLDNDLYVMLNMHHDTGWIFRMKDEYDKVLAQFEAAWTQIAGYFKDYPHKLMFESLNEPRFDDDWNKDTPQYFEMLDTLNKSFHRIVRSSGGLNADRPLVLSTMTASTTQVRFDQLAKTMKELDDDRLIATFHYYGHWPFSVNVAGATKFDQTVKLDLIGAFDRAYETFTAEGIPVIVGEYGLLGFDKELGTIQHGEMLKFFEYITYYGQEKEMPLMLWDNGQHYQRRLFRWSDESLYQTIMAKKGERSSYTSSDSIFLKKGGEIKDRRLKLELNGNELVKITVGEKELEESIDYDVSYGYLVIKKSLLEKLITGDVGVNAVLTCEFSAGAPWDIQVILFDTPVLEAAKGTTRRFRIPTEFNGDRLATMEAVYQTGGSAGPHSWTSYKEFNHCFQPLYDLNSIELTSNFFQEVRDQAEVRLKFHFWSGEVVEYTVIKNGTGVEGFN